MDSTHEFVEKLHENQQKQQKNKNNPESEQGQQLANKRKGTMK